MVKVKIEFETKETGKCVSYETTLKEKENMFGEIVCFKVDGKSYAYAIGSMRVYESIGNVLCANKVELNWLNVEYEF